LILRELLTSEFIPQVESEIKHFQWIKSEMHEYATNHSIVNL